MFEHSFARSGRRHRNPARLAGLAVLLVLLAGPAVAGTSVWVSHVTAAAGWKTSVSVFNPTFDNFFGIDYALAKYDASGSFLGTETGTVAGRGWTHIPPETLNFEGSAHITSDDNLVVKVAYQFGDTPSVCEFYLKEGAQNQWILPNTIRPWMDYTGLAVLNTEYASIDIGVEARKNGVTVATLAQPVTLAPHAKYVRLSDQIWTGVGYADADTFVVTSSAYIQAPLSITGNFAQDRHLFFAAQPAVPIRDPLVATPPGTDVWASHISAAAGWHTGISVYNPSNYNGLVRLDRYDELGSDLGSQTATVPPRDWQALDGAWLQYEGSAHVTSNKYMLVKLEFQYGGTPSACEFYLTGGQYFKWVLPNIVRPWMDWTGLAAVNTDELTQGVCFISFLEADWLGIIVQDLDFRSKYVRLTEGIWPGIGYQDLDTILIFSDDASKWIGTKFAAPISITGNTAQDRHLFFAAEPMPPNEPGELVWKDDIVDYMNYCRHGSFTQGSPADEPCRGTDEDRFTHTINRNFVTMGYEVTRGMWAALKAVQPSLPADPSHLFGGDTVDHPVQNVTWFEAVLFANLLSDHHGLEPCYYKDAAFTVPVTAANYTTGSFYCDFNATGFRLPTEGEWEYTCRGRGYSSPFPTYQGIKEHNYTASNCGLPSTSGMYPNLEGIAWFRANSGGRTQKVGYTASQPWSQLDMLGNVWEWCWDWYEADYPTGAATDYTGPESGIDRRVVRGGAWDRDAQHCRAANREYCVMSSRYPAIGFRLVRTYP